MKPSASYARHPDGLLSKKNKEKPKTGTFDQAV